MQPIVETYIKRCTPLRLSVSVTGYWQQPEPQLPHDVPQQLEQSVHAQLAAFALVLEFIEANTVPIASRLPSAAIKSLVFMIFSFQ